MTDERTEVREVLEALSADPPPTRLSVDEICSAARRARPRPAVAAWLRRLSVPLPSGRLIAQVVAIAAIAAVLPGLVLVGFLTSPQGGVSSTGGGGGGGAGLVPAKGGPGADSGRSATAGGAAGAPQVLDRSKLARVTYVPAGYRPNGDCTPPGVARADAASPPAVARCISLYSVDLPGGGGLGLSVTQYLGRRPADRGGPTWDAPAGAHVHGHAAQLRLGHEAGKVPGQVWYTRQLLWTENGIDVTVSSGPADSPGALLPAAELLRIGDGIHW